MFVSHEENTYLNVWKSRKEKPQNEMILVVGKSGHGKGLFSEALVEEYHNAGYLVIVLADPKLEVEYGYALFEPVEDYHLTKLKIIKKKPGTKNVKLYHPFTFNLPRQALPEMNLFTFSLKDLGRKEWSMLVEASSDTDTIKLLLSASANISRKDGIYGFVHHIQERIQGKQSGKSLRPDPKNFWLPVTSGTAKSMQDIANNFSPFKSDAFLAHEDCQLNLNWREILKDQEHYHVFISKWIRDPKLREFCVLALFNQVIANKDFANTPILFVMPEIRYLTPIIVNKKTPAYKIFLSEGIKDNLSMIRSQGRGMSALMDTQVYTDVDESVADSPTVTFIGELGGTRDLEKVVKARGYGKDMRQQLSNIGAKAAFFMVGREALGPIGAFYPSHRHCEPAYNFVEHYREAFPENMHDYKDLIVTMRDFVDAEESKFKEKMKRMEKEEREREAEKVRAREAKHGRSEKVDKQLEKAQEMQAKSRRELMKIVYLYREENPDISFRQIGMKFGIDHKTAKRYWQEQTALLSASSEKAEIASVEKPVAEDYESTALEELGDEKSDIVVDKI